jgi:hypothetical protein
MPVYRFTRFIATDVIEVEADTPEQAEVLIQKAGVQVRGDFSHTEIEEVKGEFRGYKEVTTRDVLGAVKGR